LSVSTPVPSSVVAISAITSDGRLLAYRELDDALSLTDTAADTLADARTGRSGRHRLTGLLPHRCLGGWPATSAASDSQMGRFETKWFCRQDQDRREDRQPRALRHVPNGQVAVPRQMIIDILSLIARLSGASAI
jgi:hypothetical protein